MPTSVIPMKVFFIKADIVRQGGYFRLGINMREIHNV